jgi:hypothetical protein
VSEPEGRATSLSMRRTRARFSHSSGSRSGSSWGKSARARASLYFWMERASLVRRERELIHEF